MAGTDAGSVGGDATAPTTVVVADDSMAIREVISQMIEGHPSFVVLGCASDGQEAIEFVEQKEPDILVVDVQMPRLDGLSATARVKERWPTTKVVVFTSAYDETTIGAVFDAGADAYVCKHDSWDRLFDCLEAFRNGRRWISLITPEGRTLNR